MGAGVSDRLTALLGTKSVVAGGLAVIGGSLAGLAFLTSDTAYWVIAVEMFTLGAGMGTAMAPSTDAVTGSVPEANAGVGSALNDVTRNVGGALGVGIMGSILNSVYSSSITSPVVDLPAGAAEGARNSIGAASQIASGLSGAAGSTLQTSANGAFIDGFGVAMAAIAAVTVGAALVVIRYMPAMATDPDPTPMPTENLALGEALAAMD